MDETFLVEPLQRNHYNPFNTAELNQAEMVWHADVGTPSKLLEELQWCKAAIKAKTVKNQENLKYETQFVFHFLLFGTNICYPTDFSSVLHCGKRVKIK